MSPWLVMMLVWLGASVLLSPVIGRALHTHAPHCPLPPRTSFQSVSGPPSMTGRRASR